MSPAFEHKPSHQTQTELIEQEWPRNFFGDPVPSLSDVLQHQRLGRAVAPALEHLLEELGASPDTAERLRKDLFKILGEHIRPDVHERMLHRLLENEALIEPCHRLLHQRAQLIVAQLRGHMPEGHVLELGSGSGEIAKVLARHGHDIVLSDVVKFPEVEKIALPFKGLPPEGRLPFPDAQFDGILALTSLHHSNNPAELIQETARILKPQGKLVAIETVYGISNIIPELRHQPGIINFLGLPSSTQRLFNCFFDILASRVLAYHEEPRMKLGAPCNFATIEKWSELFDQAGLRTVEVEHLGLDQSFVPGYHTLHVIEKA